MMLITGMPRSGTSFMQTVFSHYGHLMDPPLFTRMNFSPGEIYNLSEPAVLGRLCHTPGGKQKFLEAMKLIESYWRSPDELIIKLPQMCFYPAVCKEFTKIIVCVSPVDERFLKSAKDHRIGGWFRANPKFIKNLARRDLHGLGTAWSDAAHFLHNADPGRSDLMVFGSKNDFDRIMSVYLDQKIIDEAWATHWRGSRF